MMFLPIIFILAILFRVFLVSNLSSFAPNYLVYFSGVLNIGLIFLITRKILNKKTAYFAALLYGLSPWSAYLELAGSNYIFITSLVLILFLSLLSLHKKSFQVISLALFLLVLFKSTDIALYSDVGLVNSVNEFRGDTMDTSFKLLGKFSENRYIYLSEHLVFNILKHISPVTYFTQESKLLNFSFSPPIYVGLLIPFLLGLSLWIDLWKKYKYKLLIVLGLIIPSVLSRFSPDLTKLIIFSPVIVVTIAYGFVNILLPSKKTLLRFLLLLTILLVGLQMLTTFLDIPTRENLRYQRSITINR